VLYSDFTELRYAAGKAWLMTLLHHETRMVPGWALGGHADAALALQAWSWAWRWLRRHGVPVECLIVHHDRDPVYTGYGWTGQLLVKDHVRLSPTLADWQRFVAQRITYCNGRQRHSSLSRRAPLIYLNGLLPEGSTQDLAVKTVQEMGRAPA
jgi:hypothetical protein